MVGYQLCEGSKGLNALSPNSLTTIYKLLSSVEMSEIKSPKFKKKKFNHFSKHIFQCAFEMHLIITHAKVHTQ
jgi:hypothetical protein